MSSKFIQIYRAGGASPTTPTLVGPKILSFKFKALYFRSYGRINNCHIEVLFEWSDQSCTPSAAPDLCVLLNKSEARESKLFNINGFSCHVECRKNHARSNTFKKAPRSSRACFVLCES